MYLQSYINSLIENNLKKDENIIEIDLILDGGAFNGVYMLGALFFLKELEKRKVVKIKRISGCSVGALLGCLYALDRLDIALYISNESFISFRKYQNLKKIRKKIFLLFYKNFQDYDFSKLNGKFYLTYFDTKNGKQCLVKNYKCLTDVTDSLFKSMHVPFLIDGNTKYKNGGIDGAFPYIFKKRFTERKLLFINLQALSKLSKMIVIKKEENLFTRLFEGIHECNNFFKTNNANTLLSFIDEWDLKDVLLFRLRELIYVILVYFFTLGLNIENLIPRKWKKNVILQQHVKILKRLWREFITYISI